MAETGTAKTRVEVDEDVITTIAETLGQFDALLNSAFEILDKVVHVQTVMISTYDDPSVSGRRRMVEPAHQLLKEASMLLKSLQEIHPAADDDIS